MRQRRTQRRRLHKTIRLVPQQPRQGLACRRFFPLAQRVTHLQSHARISVRHLRHHRRQQLRRTRYPRFAQPHRLPPHPGVPVVHRAHDDRRLQCSDPLQRPQRLRARRRSRRIHREPFQSRRSSAFLPPRQLLLGEVAHYAARTLQRRDQPGHVRPIQSRHRAQRHAFCPHAIDPSLILARPQIADPLLPLRRNPLRMLNHQPIHVRNVQRPVRTRAHRREARPQIRRRKKFRRLLSRRALADK